MFLCGRSSFVPEQQQAASEAVGCALPPIGCLQGWFMETLRSSVSCSPSLWHVAAPSFSPPEGRVRAMGRSLPLAWLLVSRLGGR